MFLGTQQVNGEGHLEIGGCDAVELAKDFGTPLYVLDEDCFRGRCREYLRSFQEYGPGCLVAYAGKALITFAVCRIAQQEGCGLDVSSEGELYTALRAGFASDRILFHGNNKARQELAMAVDHGLYRVVLDSFEEIRSLQSVSKERGTVVDTLIRVTPGVAADTHLDLQTGKVDTKFGFCMAGNVALHAVQEVLACPNLALRGLHCHIGSQILEVEPFYRAARMMIDFAADLKDRTGFVMEDLDLGGGLGVRYLEEHNPPPVHEFAQGLIGALEEQCMRRGTALPRLILEPGRSLIGEAGTTLYTVGVVKDTGLRTYVSVDGGLSDNPRPGLYDARYDAIVANKASEPRSMVVTVSGRHCETDTLIEELSVPEIAPGDVLAVQTTGAYNHSMASNYNRLPRPAMVLVSGGVAELIVKRESLEDLVRMDRMPERLQGVNHDLAVAGAGRRRVAASRRLL